jgi:glycosyltransferase involved in cell wall biosynthesis
VKPVLFVAGHAPAYRVGAFARLHEHEHIELALFGGRSIHGGDTAAGELPFPHRHVRPAQLAALAASGRYRAVVCPTGGRLAPLASWAGARRARVPLILWASLWAHPRTLAHAFTYPPLLRLYRAADALVTYGPHVSAYVRARGASNVFEAPQSVDNEFWSARERPASPDLDDWPGHAEARFLFVGRPVPEKGLHVLLDAWRAAQLDASNALVLAGEDDAPGLGHREQPGQRGAAASAGGAPGSEHGHAPAPVHLGRLTATQLRDVYAACHVLVVPSLPTRTFREPWGLVVNETMNQGLAVIVSDAVGAAAGGLVRDEHNGLVVPAGDARALADALARLAGDAQLRARLGAAGRHDVRAYDHEAWAQGFSRALASLGVSRARW